MTLEEAIRYTTQARVFCIPLEVHVDGHDVADCSGRRRVETFLPARIARHSASVISRMFMAWPFVT